MAFDFKKEYKEFYLPPKTPQLVTVPPMNDIAVRGTGTVGNGDSPPCPKVRRGKMTIGALKAEELDAALKLVWNVSASGNRQSTF